MTRVLALLGNMPEAADLGRLVQELGWTLETATDLHQLRELSAGFKPAAILFDASALNVSWGEALRLVREIDPNALLIPCHRFSDVLNWPDLVDQGAFHALAFPFDPREVRQSLAFVWSARRRQAVGLVPMRTVTPDESDECDGSPQHGSCVA